MSLFYELRLRLTSLKIGTVIMLFVLIAFSQVSENFNKDFFSMAPVYYYLYYAFSLSVTPFILVIVVALPSIQLFIKAYHSKYYYLSLVRSGYNKFVYHQISLALILSYIIAFIGGLLFMMIISSKSPLIVSEGNFNAGARMANQWLLERGQIHLFYFQLLNLLSLNISFYVLTGFIFSIYYPNPRMAFLFSGTFWYLFSILDSLFILSPGNILSLTNYSREILMSFNIYSYELEFIFPYIYFAFILIIYFYLAKLAIKYQVHLFDKEE